MTIIDSITNLTSPAMMHAIATRAGAFWLAYVLTFVVTIASWTAPRRKSRIWN